VKCRRLALLASGFAALLILQGCGHPSLDGRWVEEATGNVLDADAEWITDWTGVEYPYTVTGESVLEITLDGQLMVVQFDLEGDTLVLGDPYSATFHREGSAANAAAEETREEARVKAEAEAEEARAMAEAEARAAAAAAAEQAAAAAEAQRLQGECASNRQEVLQALDDYAIDNWGNSNAGYYSTGDVYPHVSAISGYDVLVATLRNGTDTSPYSDFGAVCPDGGAYELTWSRDRVPLLTIGCSKHGAFALDAFGNPY